MEISTFTKGQLGLCRFCHPGINVRQSPWTSSSFPYLAEAPFSHLASILEPHHGTCWGGFCVLSIPGGLWGLLCAWVGMLPVMEGAITYPLWVLSVLPLLLRGLPPPCVLLQGP